MHRRVCSHWNVAWPDVFLCKEWRCCVKEMFFKCCRWSFKCGQGRLLGFFSYTQAISQLNVLLFLSQTIQRLKLVCFTSCQLLWKCKSLIDWDVCWPTIALVPCIIYHLFCFSKFWVDCPISPFLVFVLDCIASRNWGFDRKNAAVNKTNG